jgi:hypothetical protein
MVSRGWASCKPPPGKGPGVGAPGKVAPLPPPAKPPSKLASFQSPIIQRRLPVDGAPPKVPPIQGPGAGAPGKVPPLGSPAKPPSKLASFQSPIVQPPSRGPHLWRYPWTGLFLTCPPSKAPGPSAPRKVAPQPPNDARHPQLAGRFVPSSKSSSQLAYI